MKFSPVLNLFILALAWSAPAFAKTVRYELVVENKPVNMSGKKTVDFALTVNGGIPGPTLEFTEGDDAEIVVINKVPNQEVSTHWHGILLPPLMDGVAYTNTPPIYSGQSFTFKFKIRQHGTYWYHSHTGVQEQKGVYGAIVIQPKKKTIAYDKEAVVVISDWTDENADQVLRNLRKDGDYYLYKKDSVRSYLGAIKAGGLTSLLSNEWIRMGGMDLSDVGYDAFLINGKKDSQLLMAHPGERVRLRIINAAASSYFYVSLGQTPMKVISADGVDIQPSMAKEILIGMAETYDVLFTVPEHNNYELRATAQDVTGFASAWIGMGPKVSAPDKPQPDLYASMDHMGHGGHAGHSGMSTDHGEHTPGDATKGHAAHSEASTKPMDHSEHAGHDIKDMPEMKMPSGHEHMGHGAQAASPHAGHTGATESPGPVIDTLTVDELKASAPTTLPKDKKVHDVKLVLGGDMDRYVWHINGKAMFEDRTIEINEGDIVRFTFVNDTMMHHPMHLHGHFFRVLNKNGEFSPLKHTVDVSPHTTRTIEFYANEPGQWMLHCHNLYHMKTGMARLVKYSSFVPQPEMAHSEKHDPHLHDHKYYYGKTEFSSNHGEVYLRGSDTWNQLEMRLEGANIDGKNFSYKGHEWDYEGDLFYRRWFGNWLNLIAGGTTYEEKVTGVLGVGYILPMMIHTNALVNHEGKFRLDVEKRFQWTKTIFSDVDFTWRPDQGGHEEEIEVSLMYAPSWRWSAGLMLTNDSLGGGVEFQF
jgi:CopA family copper-resistance protein